MTIFGLSLFQLFLVVFVIALAVVGAEQVRTHVLQPMLLKARAWLSTTEAKVVNEFETLLGHAKATISVLPGGSTVEAKSGTASVVISTPELAKDVTPAGAAVTPLDPVEAAKRYIAGGMTQPNGMPVLGELLYLFGLAKAAQVAWGQTAAQAIAGVLTTPFEAVTVGDVGPVRPEAATYLAAIGSGYPIAGSTQWTKA